MITPARFPNEVIPMGFSDAVACYFYHMVVPPGLMGIFLQSHRDDHMVEIVWIDRKSPSGTTPLMQGLGCSRCFGGQAQGTKKFFQLLPIRHSRSDLYLPIEAPHTGGASFVLLVILHLEMNSAKPITS